MEETILQKASELFLEQGFKSVTMDDIANELGISKKTIYQYYASKPELVEKTILFINSKISRELAHHLSSDLDSITEMLEAHRKIDEIFTINKSASIHQLKKYYPKIAQKVRSIHLTQYLNLLQKNLKKGIEQGLYHPDIDIEFSSRFFFSSHIALEDTDIFPEKDFDLNLIHKQHLEYYIRSIATQKGYLKLEELKNTRTKKQN